MELGKWVVVFCCGYAACVGAQESGRLSNELEYRLEHSEASKGRASIWLVVKAGMMHEGEKELGFAHLVEHLTWSGTKNLNAQQVVDEAMYLGGGDEVAQIGAVTGMDAAYFQLDIDLSRPKSLERTLFLLKELAGSALLPSDALDSQKEEVLQELRDKMKEPNLAKLEAQLAILLGRPVSFFPQAVVEATQKAGAEALRDFYRAKYRPHRMALIAVGDFDEGALKKRVEEYFGSIENTPAVAVEPQHAMVAEPGTSWLFYRNEAFKLPQLSVAYLLPLGDQRALRLSIQKGLQQLVDGGSALSCWSHVIVVSESYQLLEAGIVLFDASHIVSVVDWLAHFTSLIEQPEWMTCQAKPLGNEACAGVYAQQFLHPAREGNTVLQNYPKLMTVAYWQD